MTPQFLAVEVLNGLQYGMLLLLVTVALALIFGLMDVINFAHGALYALGAYVGIAVVGLTKQFWLALLVAPLAVALFGLVVEALLIRRLRGRPPIDTLLLTFGLALALEAAIRLIWGNGSYSIDAPTEEDDLAPGWLYGALDTLFAPVAPPGSYEFRIGGEVAGLVDGEATRGSIEDPDVVVEGGVDSFYWLFVERRWDGVKIEGDRELLERLFDAAVAPTPGASMLV